MDNLAMDEPNAASFRKASTVVEPAVNLYRRRWLMLAILSLISMMNEVIWLSLASVSSIVQDYYRVSYTSVNWMAMIFSCMYVSVIFSVYVLNKYGLRVTIVGGALCNTIGSVLRVIGYRRNGFMLAFLGTAFGGIGQTFLIFLPPTLSSVWFGENERARASSIGMLMNMLGCGVGFLMGSMFIPNSQDFDGAVKRGIFRCLLTQAVINGVLLIVAVIFIREAPPTPPTRSRAVSIQRKQSKASGGNPALEIQKYPPTPVEIQEQLPTQSTGFFKNWKMLLTHRMFHLLSQAYGLYFGLFVSTNSLLNQLATQQFPGKDRLIGMMGFTAVLFGLLAIMLAGVFIDKTHRYKMLSVGIFTSCVSSFLLFTLVLRYSSSFIATFACYCVYGFASYSYLSVGLEYIAEIMYPIKESILSFILIFMGSLYAVVFTYVFGIVIHKVGADCAGYVATGLYGVGLLCVVLVKGELKRLNVDREHDVQHVYNNPLS